MSRKKSQLLKIDELIFDEERYPRIKVGWLTAYQYAQAIRAGSIFPPILVGQLAGTHEKNKYGFRSRWKGLVLEGSKIKVFETQTSDPPMLGNEIYDFCGAVCTFDHRTLPPISLEELLKEEGKALIADVLVFIQHDDEMGGVVWPYVFRYFFDPINNKWRVKRQIQYSNKNKPSPGGLFLH